MFQHMFSCAVYSKQRAVSSKQGAVSNKRGAVSSKRGAVSSKRGAVNSKKGVLKRTGPNCFSVCVQVLARPTGSTVHCQPSAAPASSPLRHNLQTTLPTHKLIPLMVPVVM